MRILFTLLGLLFYTVSSGQNCFCDKDATLKEIINCDTVKFDNQSKLYWRFNCDSSWLTFESQTHQKVILYSLGDGLQDLTGRLGFVYVKEYKHSFLIQDNVISGCCDPPIFFLFDKITGHIKDSLGCLLYYSETNTLPFTVGITGSSNPRINNNSLTIYNVNNQKKYYVKLPTGQIDQALKKTGEMFPEHLFEEPIRKGTNLILKYSLNNATHKNRKKTRIIVIDLKKYSR